MPSRRWIPLLLVVTLLTPTNASVARATAVHHAANSECVFAPSFAALRDRMMDVVGVCLGDAWDDPVSGDVVQLTSTGTLISRQAEGETLFTDGLSVWLDGPEGPIARPLAEALSPAPGPEPAAQQRPASPHAPRSARDLLVDSGADETDIAPGDGICATAGGRCTLRAAINEANAMPSLDRVIVPSGVYKLGIDGSGEDGAATGDLDVTDDLMLIGAGAGETYLQGAGLDRVLDIRPGARAAVRGVRIRRGTVWQDDGGGIRNAGRLTLTDASVSSNKVFDGHGGGIFTTPGSATVLVNTSVWHSKATDEGSGLLGGGGGIYNQGTLWLLNATVTNNQADGSTGGGLLNRGVTIMTSSTITTNAAVAGAGSIENALGVVQLKNSIVARSLRGGDCAGEIVSRGHNLIQDPADCRVVGETTGNIVGRDPRMGDLIEDGPRAGSRDLLASSPAVDAGTNAGCPAYDQRGAPRPRDGRGEGHATCDIGAIELQPG